MTSVQVVVPVKALAEAKSRLDLSSAQRRSVAHQLAQHTLRTVTTRLRPDALTVVSADSTIADLTRQLGARWVFDPYRDLNLAVSHAVGRLRLSRPVLVLVADLPRLSPASLDTLVACAETATEPSFVADIAGGGTTAAILPSGVRLPTLFGAESADRFRHAGWLRLEDIADDARADLDTLSDLHAYGLPATACL